jgi:hypothetical protein
MSLLGGIKNLVANLPIQFSTSPGKWAIAYFSNFSTKQIIELVHTDINLSAQLPFFHSSPSAERGRGL